MACIPTASLRAWFPRWLESLLSSQVDDDDFWDDQEVPPDIRTGDTAFGPTRIKSMSSGLHQADIQKNTQRQSPETSPGKPLPAGTHYFFGLTLNPPGDASRAKPIYSTQSYESGETIALPSLDIQVPEKAAILASEARNSGSKDDLSAQSNFSRPF